MTKKAIILIFFFVGLSLTIQPLAPSTYRAALEASSTKAPCRIHQNQHLHEVMNRVCTLCHQMYSHRFPNYHSECYANCFRNYRFRECLNIFRPPGARGFDDLK